MNPKENPQPTKPNVQSATDWVTSATRLYEKYIFGYAIVLILWITFSTFILGFEFSFFSPSTNFFLNFVCFVLLSVGFIWVCKRVNFFSKESNEIEQKIKAYLKDNTNPNAEQDIRKQLSDQGKLPPNKLQTRAIMFIGISILFEVFFVTSWVKNMALVWQPAWVDYLVHLVKDNLFVSGNENGAVWLNFTTHTKFFDFKLMDSYPFLYHTFTSEQDFLKSSYADVACLFHLWRFFSFPAMVVAVLILMWQVLGWHGADKYRFNHITGIWDVIKKLGWSAFAFVVMCGFLYAYMFSIGRSAESVSGLGALFGYLFFLLPHINVAFCIKYLMNWYFFWQSILNKQ